MSEYIVAAAWAALGLGIAWLCCLFRVMRAAVLVGGVAALVAYLTRRNCSHL